MQTMISLHRIGSVLSTAGILLSGAGAYAQQMADSAFDVTVKRPAYTQTHPTVVIDAAHANFHTAEGRYKPFADLLRSDGYDVRSGTKKFEPGSLKDVRVLVISNAEGPETGDETSTPAFSEDECDVVRDWVRAGGALLLIADHAPFGSAAQNLAKRFGLAMGKGYVFDVTHSQDRPSFLVFSRDNGLLGEHPILEGRNTSEKIKKVMAFTGQSLSVPSGAAALLKLSPTAYEAPTREQLSAASDAAMKNAQGNVSSNTHAAPVGGRALGIAVRFGKGRLVAFGEAAMFSAQVVRQQEGGREREVEMGMNVAGSDDRQLALNAVHWLSGLLD